MAQAEWHGKRLAQSDRFELVEGNVYFPPDALDRSCFRPSPTRTRCGWKGEAHYYDVVVGDQINRDAAWYYPDPLPAAGAIKDHVAFWRGVEVSR
jgi:uncharacterized protein (DUF427 family)